MSPLTQRELMQKVQRLADRRGVGLSELIWGLVEAEVLSDERTRDSDDVLCDLLFRDFGRVKLDRTPGKHQSLADRFGRLARRLCPIAPRRYRLWTKHVSIDRCVAVLLAASATSKRSAHCS